MPLSVNQTISYKPDLIDITKEYGGVDLIFFAHQMLAAGYQSAVVSVPGCKNFMVSCE